MMKADLVIYYWLGEDEQWYQWYVDERGGLLEGTLEEAAQDWQGVERLDDIDHEIIQMSAMRYYRPARAER